MRAACRFAVWDPSRTDYGNPAVCEAAHDYLKENCAVNGLEDIFDNPSQSRTAALNHQLSVEASYVKGILKDLVRAGVLPEPGKTKTSLTKSVRDGMSKFTGSRKNSTVQHAIHLLILRAFARTKPHLLKESTRSKESQPPSESMTEQTVVAVDRSQKQRAPGTAANRTDFFSCLTTFFQEHQEKWGDNVSNGGWVKYIDDAIQVERREHPEDLLPIIPTRDSSASAASTSTGTPVYNPSLPGQVESHGGTFMTPPPPSNLSQFSALFLSPGVSN
ncbi:hypothetical protein BOTBODRAFT_182350 [Botryobasidium botryosum FD-172 SS1]|uniref:Uncharacterized protein n=1 Tax=Botryobasidium botryosum (strain FD-172 SS1) TaxID=930990 RepID=A0A067M1A0_BOTB1|nr:hypothetical protein BOTBODRAFT_182350 [Botryobasidium botryosum FD-172 SS1]